MPDTRRPPPACLLSLDLSRVATHPLDRSHSLPCFSPPLLSLPLAPERNRRRRSSLSRPPPPPRPSDVPESSASMSPSYAPRQAMPEALEHRHRRLLQPRSVEIAGDRAPAPLLPRAPQDHRCTPRELLLRSPPPTCSFVSCSRRPLRAREHSASGHVAAAATAAATCVQVHHRFHLAPRSRAHPSASPVVPPNAEPGLTIVRSLPRACLWRAHSTLAPPVCSISCARAPATCRTKPRSIWSTVGKIRAPPPSLASPATSRGPSPARLTHLTWGLTPPTRVTDAWAMPLFSLGVSLISTN